MEEFIDPNPMLGALPSQIIAELIEKNEIAGSAPAHIQPSSLDLAITDEIYEVDGVILPKRGESIQDIIEAAHGKRRSLAEPLRCKHVYCMRCAETLALSRSIYAYANNKSSTGRINLQVRLVCNGVSRFDHIPKGYTGELWVFVSPHSFSVKLTAGQTLNQMRFFNADTRLSEQEHRALHEYYPLLYDGEGRLIDGKDILFEEGGGVTMTIDLKNDIVGYVAFAQPNNVLDFARRDYDPSAFFKTIRATDNGQIILDKEGFYIFITKEYISVPPEFAVEMIPYDTSKGEFRSHYAGFFDPGWGHGRRGEIKGTPAVLEVYPHDNNVIFRDGQPICKMVYERLATFPTAIYGTEQLDSHYTRQRISSALSKHFKKSA